MDHSLLQNTVDFIGHAIALHPDDTYLRQPAWPTVERIKAYRDSLLRFYGLRSPYIYPSYGLGELPQAFARLSAVYGGVYMLNSQAEVTLDDMGIATGAKLTLDGETRHVTAPVIIGDPSYFPVEKTVVTSKVVRAIAILSHPLPNTKDANSCQLILPQRQVSCVVK